LNYQNDDIMSRDEILHEIREDLTNLFNCTDEPEVKRIIRTILNRDYIDYVKCPKCGNKFEPEDGLKHSFKILPLPDMSNLN